MRFTIPLALENAHFLSFFKRRIPIAKRKHLQLQICNCKRYISLILFLFISACTTTSAYRHQLCQWQGKNIRVLASRWGQPDAAIKLANGHVLYQYTQKTFYTIPGPNNRPFHTNNGSLFSSYHEPWLRNNNQTLVRYCRTTFETNKKGDIIHTSFSGNNCPGACLIR
jgi:hypothetical protein